MPFPLERQHCGGPEPDFQDIFPKMLSRSVSVTQDPAPVHLLTLDWFLCLACKVQTILSMHMWSPHYKRGFDPLIQMRL